MEYRLNRHSKVQDGLQVEDILRFRMNYRLKRYIKVQDGLQVE